MVSNPFQDGLSVKIGADTSGFQSAMDSAGGALGGLRGKVGKLGMALAAGGVAAGVGLAAAFGTAAKKASDFESSMADVEKVTDPKTAAAMKDEIKGIAEEIPIAQGELATLAEQAGKFGVEGSENISKFVKTVGKIQTATDMSAEVAGKRFAKIAGAIGMPMSEIDKLGNGVNKLADSMKTDAGEITDTATRAANTLGQQLGLGQDAVVALSASMNEVSPSSRRAASSLRRAAESLMDPKKVEDVAGALGMSADKFRAMRKESPQKLMNKVAKAMADGGKTATALRGILGKAATDFSKLGKQMGRTEEAQGKVNKQFKDGTSLQKEMDIRTETTAGKFKLMKNKLNNVAITVGDMLLPYLNDLLDWASDAIGDFGKFIDKAGGMKDALSKIGSFLGGEGRSKIKGGLGKVSGAFKETFDNIKENAIPKFKGAIAGIGTGIKLAVEGKIGEGLSKLNGAFEDVLSGTRIAAVGEGGKGGIIGKMLEQTRGSLESSASGIAAAAEAGFKNPIVTAAEQTWTALLGGDGGGGEGLLDKFIGEIATLLKSDGAIALQKAGFKMFGKALRATALEIFNLVMWRDDSLIKTLISDIGSYLATDALGDLKEAAEIMFDGIMAAAEGLYEGLIGKSLIPEMFTDIANYIKNDAASDLKDAAVNAAEAAANGLKNKFNSMLPDQISIPSVTVGGGSFMGKSLPSATIGGQSLSIPQLASGGFIERGGLAALHAGERVVPAADVDRGGGGGTTIRIDRIEASGQAEGQAAARALKTELRSHNF